MIRRLKNGVAVEEGDGNGEAVRTSTLSQKKVIAAETFQESTGKTLEAHFLGSGCFSEGTLADAR